METKILITGLTLIVLFSGCIGTEKPEEVTTTVLMTTTTSIVTTTLPATSTTTTSTILKITTTSSTTTTIRDTDGSKHLLWNYTTEGTVNKVVITPNGRYILAGADKGHLYMFDKSGELEWKKKSGGGVLDFSMSSNGGHILAGFSSAKDTNPLYLLDRDGHIKEEYEYSVGENKYRVDGSNAYITLDGNYVLGGHRTICLFHRNGSFIWRYYLGSKSYDLANGLFVADGGVLAMIWSSNNHIYTIDKKRKKIREFKTDGIIFSASISEDLSLIAAGCRDNNVYLFKNDSLMWEYETGNWVRNVKITPDGEYIVAGSKDSNVYLFNPDGELLWNYKIIWDVLDVDISDDGEYIVAGGKDKTIYLLDKEGNLVWKFKSDSEIKDIGITPNGKYVIAGAGDKVYLFETST